MVDKIQYQLMADAADEALDQLADFCAQLVDITNTIHQLTAALIEFGERAHSIMHDAENDASITNYYKE